MTTNKYIQKLEKTFHKILFNYESLIRYLYLSQCFPLNLKLVSTGFFWYFQFCSCKLKSRCVGIAKSGRTFKFHSPITRKVQNFLGF